MSIKGRVEKLEQGAQIDAAPPRFIRLVGCSEGESLEAAVDRWCKEHPDEPRPADDDIIILRAIFSPHRVAAIREPTAGGLS